jgi:hypothetical protein
LALLLTIAASAYVAFAPTRVADDSPQVARATARLEDGQPVLVAPERVSVTAAHGQTAWALLILPPLVVAIVVLIALDRPRSTTIGGVVVLAIFGVVEALVVGHFVYVPGIVAFSVAATRTTGLSEV